MARVPYVKRDELDAEGQEIYDRIRRDRNAPEVGLQFRALLHSPKATGYLTSLGSQLRFQSAMPEDLKELAIILVAREWNSAIEWTGHAVLAARAGVSAASIEAIRTGQAPTGLTAPEQVIATKRQGANPQNPASRTRPLCPYPQVARYKGTGSIDEAANFACVTPPATPRRTNQ